MKEWAPDKIYVHRSKHVKRLCASAAQGNGDIEYTRTDLIIERAVKYIANHFLSPGMDNEIEDFKEYMKTD